MPRGEYANDPDLIRRVLDLLGHVFVGFTGAEATARSRNMHWEDVSTPFTVEKGGRVVAHVGVLEIPLVIAGTECVVGGMHGVATHPDCRGQGLLRELANAALAHCDERYETVVLTTAEPAIYERYGFRCVPEQRFVCERPPAAGSAESGALRSLDWSDPADLALLRELLMAREPVSNTLGVVRETDVFLFDTAGVELQYVPALDAVLWTTRERGTLHVYEVVARRMPTLAELLSHIAAPVERVDVFFSPDRLDADFTARTELFNGDEHFMVRGPFAAEGQPLALPAGARC